jgi:hypothetical protein
MPTGHLVVCCWNTEVYAVYMVLARGETADSNIQQFGR